MPELKEIFFKKAIKMDPSNDNWSQFNLFSLALLFMLTRYRTLRWSFPSLRATVLFFVGVQMKIIFIYRNTGPAPLRQGLGKAWKANIVPLLVVSKALRAPRRIRRITVTIVNAAFCAVKLSVPDPRSGDPVNLERRSVSGSGLLRSRIRLFCLFEKQKILV